MIASIALFLASLTILTLLVWTPIGLFISIIARPIVDASWEYHGFFGFSSLDILGAGLPAVLLFRMLLFQNDRPAKMLLIWPWVFYLLTNLIGFAIMLSYGNIFWTASLFFRIMNGFVAFYIFHVYFSDKESFRKLLIIYLIAGLFPMLMGFYEVTSGESWRIRYGVGDQLRITGLYHNSLNFRYFSYMTLTAIILYWSYYLQRGVLKKLVLLSYACICSVVLFYIFSKAAFATLGLGLIGWTIRYRKYSWFIVIVMGVFALNIISNNRVFDEIATTFFHETVVFQGERGTDFLFAGRVYGWRIMLEQWAEIDTFYQLFGTGRGGRGGGHNDYLRSLMNAGIFGLVAYVTLLLTVGVALLKKLRTDRSLLNLVGAVIYIAYLIDTVGAAPGTYPGYQVYAWGFIGLVLYGVKGLSIPAQRKASLRLGGENMLNRGRKFAK